MYRIGILWIILTIVLFAILDLTALNHLKFLGAKPDIILIAVLFFALYGGLKTGAASGFVGGLARDIFTAGPFGINILYFTLAGSFFGYNFSKFYRESPTAQLILGFFTSILYFFFYYFLSRSMGGEKDAFFIDINMLRSTSITFSLYTALAALLLFPAMRKTFRLKR